MRLRLCASAVTAGAVLFATVPLAGCTDAGVEASGVETSASSAGPTTPVSPPPAPAGSTSVAPGSDLGIVTLDKMYTDSAVKVTTTVEKAGTTWVPALPQMDDEPSGLYVRMVGIEIATDASTSDYMGVAPSGSEFSLVGADGAKASCQGLLTGDRYKANSEKMLAAVGGDVIYKYDASTRVSKGWIVCRTTKSTDASFDTPDYTIRFKRSAAKTSGGTLIPEFTFDLPVVAP